MNLVKFIESYFACANFHNLIMFIIVNISIPYNRINPTYIVDFKIVRLTGSKSNIIMRRQIQNTVYIFRDLRGEVERTT